MKNNNRKLFKTGIYILGLILISVAFNSCGFKVSRKGYKNTGIKSNCDVKIYKNLNPSQNLQKVGSITLNDDLFDFNCSEDDAVVLLKQEACSIGANIINITRENYPTFFVDKNCYRCDAEFFILRDTSYLTNTPEYFPQKKIYFTDFGRMPNEYINFYIGVDYISLNKNYWRDILSKSELSSVEILPALCSINLAYIYKSLFFGLSWAINNTGTDSNHLYNSDLIFNRFGIDFGYNIFNSNLTVSPLIGLRYFYLKHTISFKDEYLSVDEWLKHPDLSLRANQLAGIVGLNIIYPIHGITISGNFGYNFNFHKYPYLNSTNNGINNGGVKLIYNYFIGLGVGFAVPLDENYRRYSY